MIDLETKEKLLKEIEKSGNVYLSCMKTGIDKATFYRWKKNDRQFSKKANEAIKIGRENNCDIAEHSLLLKSKSGDLGAIKYQLSHNSARYKPKTRKVVIEHSQNGKKKEEFEKMKREHWDQITAGLKRSLDIAMIFSNTEDENVKRIKDMSEKIFTDIEDS